MPVVSLLCTSVQGTSRTVENSSFSSMSGPAVHSTRDVAGDGGRQHQRQPIGLTSSLGEVGLAQSFGAHGVDD